jgi:phage-related protein
MIISFVSAIIAGAIDIISKMPPWVLKMFIVTGAIASIIIAVWLIFSESARQKAGELFNQANDKLTKFVNKIEELFSNFIDIIKQIIETLKPYVQFGVDAVGYLFYSSYNLMSEMQKLEKQRAKV